MSNNYLPKLNDSQFEEHISSVLDLVNRCHRVYSKSPIEWNFVRTNVSIQCVISNLTTPQLLAFMALFSEVCSFPCFVENRNLVICNY